MTADLGYPAVTRGFDARRVPLDARFEAQGFDVQGLSGAVQELRSVGGLLTAALTIRGTVADPRVAGRLEWKDGELAVTGFGAYKGIHLALHGDASSVVLDELAGASGSGKARVTGTAKHRDDGKGYDVAAHANRTELISDVGDLDVLDLIDDEEVIVVLSSKGYIKTVAADAFRRQGRGGRGVRGGNLRDEDFVAHLLTSTAHSYLLFFSNRGESYRLRAHEIPMKERTARGTAIVNLAPARRRRAHPGGDRHPHLRRRLVPVLRHQERHGEEDQDAGVRLAARPQRAHRHQPATTATSWSG